MSRRIPRLPLLLLSLVALATTELPRASSADGSTTPETLVPTESGGKPCPEGCEKNGNCNRDLGICECNFGYEGTMQWVFRRWCGPGCRSLCSWANFCLGEPVWCTCFLSICFRSCCWSCVVKGCKGLHGVMPTCRLGSGTTPFLSAGPTCSGMHLSGCRVNPKPNMPGMEEKGSAASPVSCAGSLPAALCAPPATQLRALYLVHSADWTHLPQVLRVL